MKQCEDQITFIRFICRLFLQNFTGPKFEMNRMQKKIYFRVTALHISHNIVLDWNCCQIRHSPSLVVPPLCCATINPWKRHVSEVAKICWHIFIWILTIFFYFYCSPTSMVTTSLVLQSWNIWFNIFIWTSLQLLL